ncbi:chromosome-associated kinesin KIF4 [Stemphylium lycopersici]|nr:chromosome-associated kinesin KIF4 [Stemphylium lycopersici]
MATSPPGSPANGVSRPMSAMIRPNRSSSRMSMSSKPGGSKASDEDSRTAVKVAVRVRPPLRNGEPGYELIPQRFRNALCHVTSPSSLAVDATGGRKVFVFDRVFGEDINQEGVFEYVGDSVNSFVQGYNVSILAYGQSGAGKSYTMGTTGPKDQANADVMAPGIIPRAAALLFEKLDGPSKSAASGIRVPSRLSGMQNPSAKSSSSQPNRNWQLKATYVEIYNEQLRDLLLPEHVAHNERPQVNIREDRDGRILLTGLTQIPINSIDDMLGALNFGSAIRQTDATAVNAKSSRSHAVFSLNLVQKNSSPTPLSTREKRRSVPIEMMSGSSESWVTVDSKLHFVDLAGSERLKNTQAQGERAKEGISINAGLASLGKVISQLSARSHGGYVSYRDSRLTRLLQDSLGGNAITYMIACVNPAEFHLSETLNTVQYAQRARAIQVKPQIQQVHDDSDKQAAIDRLRAEVQFLRDQIRLSERTDRKKAGPQERVDRQDEREAELQNQLLDVQENYNALSARHAKLISEITKARDNNETETPMLKDAIGDSALERLKRSNSFAEAVESVVLEYEKTIQSLESSLSNTRSSLSTHESDLLEKETRIAILESQNQHLQSRIAKAMERDANNEEYVQSLERQIDSSANGIEKNDTVISELREKLQKARENETSSEEYISTLEERLAENEQETEIMSREIERLKHVVERQRSVAKLDNLLYELDRTDTKAEDYVYGHSKTPSDPFIEKRPKLEKRVTSESMHQFGTPVDAIPEEADSERPQTASTAAAAAAAAAAPHHNEAEEQNNNLAVKAVSNRGDADDEPSSPAQSRFVHDKLDTVTQELLDLRVEHEGTLQDYEKLASKYQEALRTLAALQDSVDEARHRGPTSAPSSRPTSFLANAGMNGLTAEDGQLSSSRTLSAELSLAESGNTNTQDEETEVGHDETKARRPSVETLSQEQHIPDTVLVQELKALKLLHNEKEECIDKLQQTYAELQEEHQDTLDYVEELKSEITKAQMNRPASPSMHMIRRKSSQAVLANDRSNRAFASLRNLALDTLEEDPDAIRNFELNLNTIMSELHIRSERVQDLEFEVQAVRKEMEGKMTLISGLTKERSSLKAGSPLDISIVASMQDQMKQNEEHIKELKGLHSQREQELQAQIESLKSSVKPADPSDDLLSSRQMPDTPPAINGDEESDEATRHNELTKLSNEAAHWQAKHLDAIEATKASERQHLDTIRELEAAKQRLEVDHALRISEIEQTKGAEAEASLQDERTKHAELIATLQAEVDEHKTTAVSNAARLAELEESHANIVKQIEEDSEARELTEKELDTHRSLVINLERQIEEHKSAIEYHQQGMDTIQKTHAVELEKLTAELTTHRETTSALEADLSKAKAEMATLLDGVSAALGEEADVSTIQSHIESLVQERKSIASRLDEAVSDLESARKELSDATTTIGTLKSNLKEFELINAETLKELEKVSEKELRSARLVQELEDQLNQNWDQHEAANNRLSALQTERTRELQDAMNHGDELEKEVQESRIKIALLESQLVDAKRNSSRVSMDPREDLQRSNSNNSTARKSTAHTSLPSPPPAIPLPPLPPGSPPPQATAPSPPTSRHQSKDIAHAQLVEDQEARIRTIEKHLFAEKQLTATLEDALTDLEASSTKTKTDLDQFKKKCAGLEEELNVMRKERSAARHSLQAVEEERNARLRVEAERAHLEARMAALNNAQKKGKKKGTLNCF